MFNRSISVLFVYNLCISNYLSCDVGQIRLVQGLITLKSCVRGGRYACSHNRCDFRLSRVVRCSSRLRSIIGCSFRLRSVIRLRSVVGFASKRVLCFSSIIDMSWLLFVQPFEYILGLDKGSEAQVSDTPLFVVVRLMVVLVSGAMLLSTQLLTLLLHRMAFVFLAQPLGLCFGSHYQLYYSTVYSVSLECFVGMVTVTSGYSSERCYWACGEPEKTRQSVWSLLL